MRPVGCFIFSVVFFFFFFNDTATTEIYTLSLHDALPILRERGRVQRTAAGHWLALGYNEVTHLLTDQRFGEAAGRGGRIRLSRTGREGPHQLLGRVDTMLSQDPPEHTRLRRRVSKAFTPRSLQKMRPRIQEKI